MDKIDLEKILKDNEDGWGSTFSPRFERDDSVKDAIKQGIKEALPKILQYVSEHSDADYVYKGVSEVHPNDMEVYVINSSITNLEQEILKQLIEE